MSFVFRFFQKLETMFARLFVVVFFNVLSSDIVVCQKLQRLTSPLVKEFSRNITNETDEIKEGKIKLADKISTLLDSVHTARTFVKNPLLA